MQHRHSGRELPAGHIEHNVQETDTAEEGTEMTALVILALKCIQGRNWMDILGIHNPNTETKNPFSVHITIGLIFRSIPSEHIHTIKPKTHSLVV